MNPSKLSVILVATDRHRSTLDSLHSVWRALGQTKIDFEVLVLLNNSPLTLCAEVEQNRSKMGSKVRVFETRERLRPGAARNLLLNSCEAPWVFFIDDDAVVPSHLFYTFLKIVEENPSAVLIGGPNLNPSDSSFFQSLSGAVLGSWWGTLYSCSRYSAKGGCRRAKESDLTSCGLFFKRELAPQFLFPDHYRTAEESHLILGLLQQFPRQCFYTPELHTFHERRKNVASFFKQIFRYAFGRGQLCREGRSGLGLFWLPTVALILGILEPKLFLAYSFVSLSFSIYLGFLWQNVRLGMCAPFGFLLIHVAYAIGFPIGLIFGNGLAMREKLLVLWKDRKKVDFAS